VTRLRQAVLAATDLEATKAKLEAHGLRDPFVDPGVEEFGLTNAVYAIGDQFLEVVSPIQDGTTAGRYLERRGDDPVGYMVIVQVDDLDETRDRAEKLRIRTVWTIDLDDIRASHLHPKDTGAITSVDQPVPPTAWRWGGPDWESRSVPGKVSAVTVGADSELWSGLLNRRVVDGVMQLDDRSEIRFVDGSGVMRIELEVDGTTISLP
jgi:hypothetical protein